MTNEQLAEFIKEGDSNELIPILWERVRALLHSMSANEYRRRPEQFQRCGVTVDDLKQCCYPDVFLKALERYDTSKGLKFTTYLTYPFWRAVEALLGTVNGRENNRPLDNYVSLSEPVNDGDQSTATLEEVIPDNDESVVEKVLSYDMQRTVREAVSRLPEPARDVITLRFFENLTFAELGSRLDMSVTQARLSCQNGLELLRTDPCILMLRT